MHGYWLSCEEVYDVLHSFMQNTPNILGLMAHMYIKEHIVPEQNIQKELNQLDCNNNFYWEYNYK